MADEHEGAVTVGELIEMLKALPQDLPVYADGCDCIGPAKGAEVEGETRGDPYVLVHR